ncbi:GNAT family N-acetyltransferase [Nocardioides sp. GXQ0305]|uniref:GNAT family N-acetyltransferase n=1 Tax=Nocardioides sp. GXQ0305 TaxID=3423912 RepID=UPI003D7C3B46
MTGPAADVSCRVAWADDAPAIARVQLATRRTDLGGLLPPEVLDVAPEEAAEAWRETLTRPPDGRVRVLVALERNRVTGFAITSPALDPDCDPVADAELMELTVDPDARGLGHGSRLLQAGVDTMVADRFRRAVLWATADDDALRRFLTDAGWAPDGAHRELDLDGSGTTTVKQVRLHTLLTDP